MRTIWRNSLNLRDKAQLQLPLGSKILKFAPSRYKPSDQIDFWVEFDNAESLNSEPRTLEIVGTGRPIPENGRYLDTVVMSDNFVWHIYETTPERF